MKKIFFITTLMVALVAGIISFVACSEEDSGSQTSKAITTKSLGEIILPDGIYSMKGSRYIIFTIEDGELKDFKDGITGEPIDPPTYFAHKLFPKNKIGEANAMAQLDAVKDYPCASMTIVINEKTQEESWMVAWGNPPCLNC